MQRSASTVRLWSAAAVLAAVTSLGACDVVSFSAQATERWSRHYSLSHGGTLDIRNTNGKTEILAGDGDAVDVTATKTARAMSDDAAKEALKDIQIEEKIAPDRIGLDSVSHGPTIDLGVSRKVDYIVHVPRWANVEVSLTNGELKIRDLAGSLHATATNGQIDGEGLTGGVSASATNGRVILDFASLGKDEISGRTTNGMIEMTLPSTSKSTLTATVTNGGISTNGLDLAISEHSRRRLEGTMNGGGTPIKLSTTNGAISVRGR